MLAFLGLCIIAAVLIGIMSKRMSPMVALILFPLAGAIAGGIGPVAASGYVVAGLRSVIPVTAMIIFALLYFGVVSDAGMLDPIVARILRTVGCHPARITLGTALLALIIHLDGSGPVTVMLTVPAMLPLYDRLGMDRRILALIIALSAGTNFLPWVGPMVRAAVVLQVSAIEIFQPLIPVQIAGLVFTFAVTYLLGKKEEKRLKLNQSQKCEVIQTYTLTEAEAAMRRPKLFWVNIILTVSIIACMVFRVLDAAVAFMVGLALALCINYPNVDEQAKRIDAHAKTALFMGTILLGAGAFVGVMQQSGMITAMANMLVQIIPHDKAHHIPFIVGIFSMPLSLFFDPDSFYFGVMPIIAETYKTLGGDPVLVARAALLGTYTTGFAVSPLTSATFLLVGMTQISLDAHQKYCIPFLWACSIFMTLFAALTGVFPF
ncbi:citrate transporter [Deltaproteobacteria bacterium]|nr:citrate transporter [Deltaproteobacteria bacterium]